MKMIVLVLHDSDLGGATAGPLLATEDCSRVLKDGFDVNILDG